MSHPTAPTTPDKPRTQSGTTSIQSTPSNVGLASHVASGGDCSTITDDVVGYVHDDLKMTPSVGLVPMLKALLVLQYQREVDPKASQSCVPEEGEQLHRISEEAKKYSDEQVDALLEAAVEYCNDPRSAPMKDALRTSLSATAERDRYHPLVHSLNTILLAFHDIKIGELRNGRDFLYVVNDPATLRSAPLSVAEDAPQARSYTIRKPDIFDPTKDHLKKLIPENEYFTFAQWVDFIHHRQKEVDAAMKGASKEKKTTWGDGSQCLELKFREALKEKDLVPLSPGYKFKAAEVLAASAPVPQPTVDAHPVERPTKKLPRKKENPAVTRIKNPQSASSERGSASSTRGGSSTSSTGRGSRGSSRGSGNSSTGSSLGKRSRPSASVESTGSKSRKDRDGKKKKSLSPEAQCALYGIELLRSRWDRTHAIVILLKDNILSLRWHDAQGCIATYPIDIVAQLPLLVAMILLFQRFGDRMRGNSGIKLEGEANGRKFKYNIPDDAHSGWELKGRRRVTATPIVERTPIPAHPRATRQNARVANTTDPLPRDDELFFKLSWREHTRQSEGFIVQTAKERAVEFLGENAGDVLNHLPEIKHSDNYPLFSTGHIRNCLDLGFQGARIPSSLLSERLAPLEDVEPDDFPLRMWEIIRCHYLLWQIGIAHGDVSLWNLMVRTSSDGVHFAVLNDFDLAAIMEPGEESPSKVGFERTGTKPFMAVDLLIKNNGMIKRLYVHDLEAMIWCMVWFLESQPRWTHGSMEAVGRDKIATSFLLNPDEPSEWAIDNDAEDLWTSVIDILKVWITSRPVAVKMAEAKKYLTNHDHLLLFDKHMPYPTRPGKEDWDSRWMSWKVLTDDVVAITETGKNNEKN